MKINKEIFKAIFQLTSNYSYWGSVQNCTKLTKQTIKGWEYYLKMITVKNSSRMVINDNHKYIIHTKHNQKSNSNSNANTINSFIKIHVVPCFRGQRNVTGCACLWFLWTVSLFGCETVMVPLWTWLSLDLSPTYLQNICMHDHVQMQACNSIIVKISSSKHHHH